MQALSKQNDGYKYILMVMDVFPKYGWAEPLKFKTAAEVNKALEKIFRDKIPKRIWADRGTEFWNKDVEKLLLKHNITLYSKTSTSLCHISLFTGS